MQPTGSAKLTGPCLPQPLTLRRLEHERRRKEIKESWHRAQRKLVGAAGVGCSQCIPTTVGVPCTCKDSLESRRCSEMQRETEVQPRPHVRSTFLRIDLFFSGHLKAHRWPGGRARGKAPVRRTWGPEHVASTHIKARHRPKHL